MRKLEKELEAYIDKKLVGNGLYFHALENNLPRIAICQAAGTLVGITEATGRNDGKFIRLIQETVGGANGEPYCAAGIMTLLAFIEKKFEIVSPVPATELAQDIWWRTPKAQRVKKFPAPGAIAVWGDVGKITGHTELVISATDKEFSCVGFNTSGTTKPGGEVNREGNGVFYTVRSYKDTAKRKLLGFVKPF